MGDRDSFAGDVDLRGFIAVEWIFDLHRIAGCFIESAQLPAVQEDLSSGHRIDGKGHNDTDPIGS